MLRAAKTIVLQGCDVEYFGTHECHGGEWSFSNLGDLLCGWLLQYDKLREKNWHAGNKHTLLPERRNFTAEVDSVCPNSQERFKP